MDGFITFLVQNQWAGFLAYVGWKEAWPFLRDKVWTRKMANIEAERTRLNKQAETERLRFEKQAQDERDRLRNLEERAAQIDERNVKAMESMSLSVQQMALEISKSNERTSQLIKDHAEHARFTQDMTFHSMRTDPARNEPVKKIEMTGKIE